MNSKNFVVFIVPLLIILILPTAEICGDQTWYGSGQIGSAVLSVPIGAHSTSFWLHWYFNSTNPLINVTVVFVVDLGGGVFGSNNMGSGKVEASGDYYYDSPSNTEYNFTVHFVHNDPSQYGNETFVMAIITKSLTSPGGTNGLSIPLASITSFLLIVIPFIYIRKRKYT
jgi:hypothetical protein